MLDLLAFKATDVPAKNTLKNSGFNRGTEGWIRYDGGNSVDQVIDGDYLKFSSPTHTSAIAQNSASTKNHQYFFSFIAKSTVDLTTSFGFATSGVGTRLNWASLSNNEKRITSIVTSDIDHSQTIFGRSSHVNESIYLKQAVVIDLTATFGAGNEPTIRQMELLLEQFPNSWFDGTKNLFNAKHMMNVYHKEMSKLRTAITASGGSV